MSEFEQSVRHNLYEIANELTRPRFYRAKNVIDENNYTDFIVNVIDIETMEYRSFSDKLEITFKSGTRATILLTTDEYTEFLKKYYPEL